MQPDVSSVIASSDGGKNLFEHEKFGGKKMVKKRRVSEGMNLKREVNGFTLGATMQYANTYKHRCQVVSQICNLQALVNKSPSLRNRPPQDSPAVLGHTFPLIYQGNGLASETHSTYLRRCHLSGV